MLAKRKKDYVERREERTDLNCSCPSSFQYGGKRLRALMVNLSEHGARFRLSVEWESDKEPAWRPGEVIDLEVLTPYGTSHCRGKLRWAQLIDGMHYIGVEFVELPEDENDPLRAYMDSPF